ncbi:MAG: ISKra4 family transposase [Chloroflexota bacterium]
MNVISQDAAREQVCQLLSGWGLPAARMAGLAEAISVLVDLVTGEAPGSAVDLEASAVTAALAAARPLLEVRLQERLDVLDEETRGVCECLLCGASAASQGRRQRRWRSLTGPLRLVRRYTQCTSCGEKRSLSQERLGLSWSEYTPRLEEVCTLMATTVPHGMAVELVEKLAGVEVSAHGIQQMTERRAQRLEAALRADASRYACYDDTGLPVDKPERPKDATKRPVGTAYIEVDGVVPMTREEVPEKDLSAQDRRRRQKAIRDGARGGRGRRYTLVGREVKNAVLYTADDCAPESPSRACLTDKRYVSHLGDWQQFAKLLWVEIVRKSFDRAQQLVLISDGAEWVRSLAKWLPVQPLLILDLFHVKHRIWEVANALYGEHTPAATAWAQIQCECVEAGQASSVIASLEALSPRAKATKLVRLLVEYLQANLDRMDYPAYRKRGLRVGSGAVESANYHVTGARLKLQGMRWSLQGAREMSYLRADLFNGRWQERTRQLPVAQ